MISRRSKRNDIPVSQSSTPVKRQPVKELKDDNLKSSTQVAQAKQTERAAQTKQAEREKQEELKDSVPVDVSSNNTDDSSDGNGSEMGLTAPEENSPPVAVSSTSVLKPTPRSSSKPSHIIDYDIKRWGYTAIQRIDITKSDGKIQTLIKARSPLGFFVFIEIDNGTYSGSTERDITMTEKGVTLPISTTVKRGVADNFPHSSAAIVCKQGICKLDWDPEKVEPIEINYVITSKHGYSNILPENSVIAFPVIKYSELTNNPTLVLELTLSATKNNREMSTSQCEESYKQLISRTNNFYRNTADFLEFRKEKVSELSSSLRTLTEEQRDLMERSNLSLGDQERIKVLAYNLGHRNDLALSYFRVRKTIQEINDNISDLTQRIDLLNAMFRGEFINLDKELEPPNL